VIQLNRYLRNKIAFLISWIILFLHSGKYCNILSCEGASGLISKGSDSLKEPEYLGQ